MDLNLVENIGNDKSSLSKPNKRAVDPSKVPTFSGYMMPPGEEAYKPYNAQEALKEMNENISKRRIKDSNVPDAIKNSIIANPLMMNESTASEMDMFTETLGKKLDSMDGIKRSMSILEQSERLDRSKTVDKMIQEAPERRRTSPSGTIDYEIIKAIVESVIDKKLGTLQQTLNESVSRKEPGLSVMKLSNKFLFLDDDDNIYECEMKYRGKNKKRKKQ